MTIGELLNLIETDPKFAKKFKAITDQCCKDRANLMTVGMDDKKAAKAFLSSWGNFYNEFAFDPISLAALTLPRFEGRTAPCRSGMATFTVLTTTQTQELYELGTSPRKAGAKAKPKTAAAKKKKAAKLR